METNGELDKFLKHTLSADESGIEAPDLALIADARKKIGLRKKTDHELNDYLMLFASFLNMKIKMYHAVLACLIIGAVIFYYTRRENEPVSPKMLYTEHISSIASVKNSTVMSCTKTFAGKN